MLPCLQLFEQLLLFYPPRPISTVKPVFNHLRNRDNLGIKGATSVLMPIQNIEVDLRNKTTLIIQDSYSQSLGYP